MWPKQAERDHPKIQNLLEGLIAEVRSGQALPSAWPGGAGVEMFALRAEGDRVQVVIEAGSEAEVPKVKERISQLGGRVELTYETSIQAIMPVLSLEELADLDKVVFIRLPVRGQRAQVEGPMISVAQGGVISEGASVIGAPDWQRAGLTGEGTGVVILDGEFGNYRRLLGRELPPADRVIARSFRSDRRMFPKGRESEFVHGTAVAEIIYDIAPGATLYLGAFETDVEWRQAIEWAISQRPNVISTSWFWRSGCFRGDGMFEPLFRRARQNGIFWSTSAGNQADRHWEGTFTDQNGNSRHEFAGRDEDITIEVELVEGEIRGRRMPVATLGFVLSWDASCTGARDDYDVVIFPSDEPRRRGEGDWTWRPGVPIKTSWWTFGFPDSRVGARKRFSVVIERKRRGARAARFDLVMFSCERCRSLEHVEPRGSISINEPAISPNVMTVGAVHHGRCPSWACPEGPLLWYSSRGPAKDGRTKPDIAAPSHVSTVSYGRYVSMERYWGFGGTSAAQPHVAGAALLVKQAFPEWGPEQIQRFLEERAEDLGPPGKDNLYGAGLLQLGQPPGPQPPTPPAGLTVQARSVRSAQLSWQDLSDNEDGFRVERRLETSPDYEEVQTLPPNTTSFIDDQLQPATAYCWRVIAFNEAGDSEPSNEACLQTPADLGFEARLTLGRPGAVELPPEVRAQLPAGVRFVERPNTTRDGRTSDALSDVGLQLDPATGTISGTPTREGSFQFLIDALLDSQWAAQIWVGLTVEVAPPPGFIAVKFVKLEFLEPEDWERELSQGCVIYRNISAERSPVRVTLPDGSVQEYEVAAGREVWVCGDVVHIDLRGGKAG